MNLCSKSSIKSLLKKHDAVPSKKMGQNFLIDKTALGKFVKAIDINPNDTVLEIGSGIGVLTQELVKRSKKVIAVEKDPKMTVILKDILKDSGNIEIIREDILKKLPGADKVVGNLPFYLTAPIIRKLLEKNAPPKEIVFIIQKEVAQRICASPPKMSILAVSVQFYADAKIMAYVGKKSFYPSPKVDSAIIKIVPHNKNKNADAKLFFKIVKAGFSQPRKQLINNLSKKLDKDKKSITNWLLKNNIQPKIRAESLNINQWTKLAQSCGLLGC